ncbi:MAG: hypothetical protein ABIT09_08390 [Croceibacterium sp.]
MLDKPFSGRLPIKRSHDCDEKEPAVSAALLAILLVVMGELVHRIQNRRPTTNFSRDLDWWNRNGYCPLSGASLF